MSEDRNLVCAFLLLFGCLGGCGDKLERTANAPSGDTSLEIRDVKVKQSDGYRDFKVSCKFLSGTYSKGQKFHLAVEHGGATSTLGAYWYGGGEVLSAFMLAPSHLNDLTSGESEAIWSQASAAELWIGVKDNEDDEGLRRVSDIVTVDMPVDDTKASLGKHAKHHLFTERAKALAASIRVDQILCDHPGRLEVIVVRDTNKKIGDLTVEADLEIQNVTTGDKWNVKQRFLCGWNVKHLIESERPSVPSDRLTARILSRRTISWIQMDADPLVKITRNRVTESFDVRRWVNPNTYPPR